jgi:hypothetical protein
MTEVMALKPKSIEELSEQLKVLQGTIRFTELDKKLSDFDDAIDVGKLASKVSMNLILPDLVDKKTFETYLTEYGEGKHVDDILLGTLIVFESEYSPRIESFLKEMKTKKDTFAHYSKEFLLNCFNFSREIEEINKKPYDARKGLREKLRKEFLEDSSYTNMLKSNITGNSARLTTSLLFLCNNLSINVTDLTDLAEEGNGRALSIIGLSFVNSDDDSDDDDDKNKENKSEDDDIKPKVMQSLKWFRRGIGKGDYLAYLMYSVVMSEKVDKLCKKTNKFTISGTTEFSDLIECTKVAIELGAAIKPKGDFMDGFFSLADDYFCVSESIRQFCLGTIARVLSDNKKYKKNIIKKAYKALRKTFDHDDDDEKEYPSLYLILDVLRTHGVDKFIEVHEKIYKRKHLPKEILDTLD